MTKIGRNDLCPCGSDEKYKYCCLGATPAPGQAAMSAHRRADLQRRLNDREPPRQGFESWLDDRAGLRRVSVVRQSDQTKTNFKSSLRAATQGWGRDDDARTMIELGADVVLPEHQALRDELGAYAVRLCDLPGGEGRRALIAYAFPVGRTLFLYVMNSAAQSTLDADHAENKANPFTEMLRVAIRRLSYASWKAGGLDQRLELLIPAHTRLVRDPAHGTALWRTMRDFNADLVVDGKHIDPQNDDDEFVFAVLSGISAKELAEIVRRLFRQKMAIIDDGNHYGSLHHLPFTHGALTYQRTADGQTWTETDKHQLIPLEAQGAKLAALVAKALELADEAPDGRVDWVALALYAGTELGIGSRLPRHVKRGGMPIHQTSEGGYQAIRKLLSGKYLDGWLTGVIYTDVKVPKQVSDQAVIWDDSVEIVIDSKGVARYRVPVRLPRPAIVCEDRHQDACEPACDEHPGCEIDWHYRTDGTHKTHGWPVADVDLERLKQLRAKSGNSGSGGKDRRRPLAGITHDDTHRGYTHQGWQYRLEPGATGVYRLQRRRIPTDPSSGWDSRRDGHPDGYPVVCTLPARPFCKRACPPGCRDHISWPQSVGQALEAALRNLDRQLVPLARPTTPTLQGSDQPDPRELEEAERDVAEAWDAVVGANAKHGAALGRVGDESHPDVVLEAQTLTKVRAVHAAAVERAEGLAASASLGPATAEPTSAQADVFTAAVLAVALQKMTDPYAPRTWNETLRRHIPPDSVRFAITNAKSRVRWELSLRLQDAKTGEWFLLPLTGEVRNRVQRRTDGSLNRASTAGELYFRDGLPFAEVNRKMGLTGDLRTKSCRLWQLLHAFLACDTTCTPTCERHVHRADLRSALVDAPRELTHLRRTVFAKVTGDATNMRAITVGYRHHIAKTYFGPVAAAPPWGWHWVGTTHTYERAALMAVGDGGFRCGLTLPAASNVTGLPPSELVDLYEAAPNGRIAPLTVTDNGRLTARRCPHKDCSARSEGGKGYATAVIWTPETHPDGVLCPDCRRTPSDPAVRFPAEYLQPWRGRIGPGSNESGARDQAGTHLDVSFASCVSASRAPK